MNRLLYFLSLFAFLTLSIWGQSVERKGSELCSEKKMNSPLQLLSDNLSSTGTHSFDMLDYNLNLDIYKCFLTPYPGSYTGTEILTLLSDSSISSIQLNAVNTSLQIDSVRLSGASFAHTNNILTIYLDRTYATGETLFVKIYYQHKNIADGAFYVQSGMVFTDCEPEGARKWFPCWDKPSDKATMNLKVITPGSVKLGSNGRLADSVKSNDTIYYNWISRDPVATYLMVISAKVNYNLDIKYWHKISNQQDSIPFRFYWNTGESGLANIETKVLQMCDLYSKLWGEHPFEKNGFATLDSLFIWGGMENQTLTSLCPNCWYENLVSHEFAHQWFGDMITCATWADIMLNEGFATFCEAIWDETTGDYSTYKTAISDDANYYLAYNPGRAISNPDWAVNTPDVNTLFNTAMTYDKGACVLHQLRYLMGDSLFFIGMHNYGTSNLRYKSATIGDYAAIMSSAFGQDLSWFFNEWVYQPNHPVYANKYYISQQGTNNWEVGFQAIQTQTNTVFFQMPLQIAINYSSGPSDTLKVFNNVNNQLFTFNVTRQPLSVVFDPKNNIVLKMAALTQVAPMPVELTTFSAEVKPGLVILKWKTASEINNSGFEIERAKVNENIDVINPKQILFETIGFVNGSGSSTTTKDYSFTDHISSFGNYVYRLKQVDLNGKYTYSSNVQVAAGAKPSSLTLNQNYPNPFNPSTTIRFEVPKNSRIKLTVYNMIGEAVRVLTDANFEEGVYEKTFDAKDMASGVYIYELKTDDVLLRQKMVLQK